MRRSPSGSTPRCACDLHLLSPVLPEPLEDLGVCRAPPLFPIIDRDEDDAEDFNVLFEGVSAPSDKDIPSRRSSIWSRRYSRYFSCALAAASSAWLSVASRPFCSSSSSSSSSPSVSTPAARPLRCQRVGLARSCEKAFVKSIWLPKLLLILRGDRGLATPRATDGDDPAALPAADSAAATAARPLAVEFEGIVDKVAFEEDEFGFGFEFEFDEAKTDEADAARAAREEDEADARPLFDISPDPENLGATAAAAAAAAVAAPEDEVEDDGDGEDVPEASMAASCRRRGAKVCQRERFT
mmetsp:Transcript_8793/g.17393  ORF Transcript_8793/g.17393 Transcript_8793/m.17393 type:complete len:298 (+) Transcript_8793:2392-3285(+)